MYIETKNSDVTVWLAKFPSYLAKKILAQDSDTNIGTITINPKKLNEIKLELSKEILKTGIPSDYTMKFTEIKQNVYILNKDEKSAKIEGIVTKECKVCPVINQSYINYKKRASQENLSKQTVVMQEVGFDKLGSIKELEGLAKKRKKMLQDKKRERLDKQEVMDIIFKAFEDNEAWTAKDLADFSGQPLAYISEILPEICYLNKKDQRSTWLLKDEYNKHMKK